MEYSLLKKIHVTRVAINYGRCKRSRLAAWAVAQIIFDCIVLVALTRTAMIVPRC